MGVGSVGSTLCFISPKDPRNDHIPIDLDRFWWNCRVDFTILFENPSPRSELEICVNNPDRDLDLGSKIGADPRQGMAKGDRGKQMRRIRFLYIKKSKIQKCSESNSGCPKNWSKSGQNNPGTIIIRFALKNYAQKWSQIVKTLEGCLQNDDFCIFVRSWRTLV